MAQTVESLPAVWETWVQSLGWEDLEKEMAIDSSILAWEIPWTEEANSDLYVNALRYDPAILLLGICQKKTYFKMIHTLQCSLQNYLK